MCVCFSVCLYVAKNLDHGHNSDGEFLLGLHTQPMKIFQITPSFKVIDLVTFALTFITKITITCIEVVTATAMIV